MSTKTKKKAGPTPIVTFRFGLETLADLDAIQKEHGLASRAAAIRLLARKEAKKIRKENPNSY